MRESFSICINAVVPLFLMMALGYLARSLKALTESEVKRLNRVLFRYFMPVMLFYNVYSSDISHMIKPKILIFAAVGVLAEFFIALAYVLLTEKEPSKRGVKIQGMYRSNFVILGLPFASALVEGADIGSVVILVAVVVPLFNVIAVIILETFNGQKPSVGKLVLDILKNPLILGIAVGIVFLLLGIKLPKVLEATVKQIASATNPMLLFLLGAFFRFEGIRGYARDLIEVVSARLLIFPAAMLFLAYALGIRGIEFAAMIAIFGSSTSVSSFTMAQQMGGDASLAGNIVVLTSAFCSFTLFAWAFLFKTLGAF